MMSAPLLNIFLNADNTVSPIVDVILDFSEVVLNILSPATDCVDIGFIDNIAIGGCKGNRLSLNSTAVLIG